MAGFFAKNKTKQIFFVYVSENDKKKKKVNKNNLKNKSKLNINSATTVVCLYIFKVRKEQ